MKNFFLGALGLYSITMTITVSEMLKIIDRENKRIKIRDEVIKKQDDIIKNFIEPLTQHTQGEGYLN